MKSNVNPVFGKFAAPAMCLAALVAGIVWGQAQSVVGTVTKVDADTRSLTVKADSGQEYEVTVGAKVNIRRIAAGETDVSKAAIIQVGEIAINDRVQAKGTADNNKIAATALFVMSRSDVTKTQNAEQADWDKRGVAGPVTAVSANSVTITVRTLAGVKPMVITLAPNGTVRRYSQESINFADAKPSSLPDIKVGDEVRARGDKNADGSAMTADEIVAGTFKTIAGLILSINAAASEMQVRDVDTKKNVTVKVNKDSSLKKLNPQLAQTIANRLHGADDQGGDARGGDARGGGGRGGRGGGGRGGAGSGGFNNGGGRGNADVTQMLESSPNVTLADLKNGDAIVVLSTVGASTDKITAIKLLAGVEPILTKPGTQEMSLGGWSLGGGGGGGD